jgi:hypothetical protein
MTMKDGLSFFRIGLQSAVEVTRLSSCGGSNHGLWVSGGTICLAGRVGHVRGGVALSGSRRGFTFTEDFSCGPVRVQKVDRSWTRTVGRRTFALVNNWFATHESSQRYEFEVAGAEGRVWDGQFSVTAGVSQLQIREFLLRDFTIDLENTNLLIGLMSSLETGATWKLVLARPSGDALMNGTLTDGTRTIDIEGSRRVANSSLPISEASGYTFLQNGRALVAVEVINAGAMWVLRASDPELRDVLTAASAALLLYRDLTTQ